MADHFDRDLRHRCRNPLFVRTVPCLRASLLRSVVGRLLVFLIYEQSSIRQRSFSLAESTPETSRANGSSTKAQLLRPRRVHAVKSTPPHFPLDTDRALSVRQYPSYLRSLVDAGNQATARGQRAPDRILFC